jgi:phosphopantothenoylcysteine decarboxylase/phosphopantothenate--cysteine ligase
MIKLAGRRIALCVTGSAAAIEAPRLARELVRHGAEVTAYMSRAATEIIHPNALEFATGKEVVLKLTGKLEHLGDYDLAIVAPATANTLGKLAHGIADTPVTALLLPAKRVLIAPAMNQRMYESPVVRANIERLKELGYVFVGPRIAEGKAKIASVEEIAEAAISMLHPKDLAGLRFLITAGATVEYLDPIRIITNKSSGKMGLALAREAYYRGAEVTLLLGRSNVAIPGYLRVLRTETLDEMLRAAEKEIPSADVFISAAAVSDFRVKKAPLKLDSRREHRVTLSPAPKILERVMKAGCIKVGFKALYNVSAEELIAAASRLMEEHNLDLVVANDVGRGIMGSDEAEVYIVSKAGAEHVPRSSKAEIASRILDAVQLIRKNAG